MLRALPFVLLCAACASDVAPTDELEVAGFVRDIDTGEAISEASVTFTSDTRYRASTTSDDDGRYEMVVETDSDFGQVRAEKEGYTVAEQTVFFDQPQRRIDLEMRAR